MPFWLNEGNRVRSQYFSRTMPTTNTAVTTMPKTGHIMSDFYGINFSVPGTCFLDTQFVMSVADGQLPTKHWTGDLRHSILIPDALKAYSVRSQLMTI